MNMYEKIVNKLGVQPPNAFLVLSYMKEIATTCGVAWKPADTLDDAGLNAPMKPPSGVDANSGAASGMNSVYGQVSFLLL